ncbi:hypothetical protein [Endozoicomonas acroporae]|uniref:hypothetical protein n=1 Tax=Endozoicomonas acroporae TaxID=1701104 RepID=UPI0013D593DC|nr:hypothetical protein [Endozoicomonas acroporae]
MSWNQWPEYSRRQSAQKLTQEQAASILKALTNAIQNSMVLMELHHAMRFARGRFYLERTTSYL